MTQQETYVRQWVACPMQMTIVIKCTARCAYKLIDQQPNKYNSFHFLIWVLFPIGFTWLSNRNPPVIYTYIYIYIYIYINTRKQALQSVCAVDTRTHKAAFNRRAWGSFKSASELTIKTFPLSCQPCLCLPFMALFHSAGGGGATQLKWHILCNECCMAFLQYLGILTLFNIYLCSIAFFQNSNTGCRFTNSIVEHRTIDMQDATHLLTLFYMWPGCPVLPCCGQTLRPLGKKGGGG